VATFRVYRFFRMRPSLIRVIFLTCLMKPIYSKASVSLSLFFKAYEVGKSGFYDKVPVRRNEALGKIPVLNFQISLLSDIMDMLRNEKPLYIQLNTDNWNGMLSTSAEPIGELEP
jgi:hypothetical protein